MIILVTIKIFQIEICMLVININIFFFLHLLEYMQSVI